ncbi:MAG: DNA polymerase III subunit delta' [Ruminococcaceae bacterium]|nr:DNA polymerase III subunit delta' [Oscillospiraceae bacterium]
MLSNVLGHEKVKRVLVGSYMENRVGHAYIFEGPKGVGRQTAAIEFAKLLLCENPREGEPCGVCKSCSMCRAGSHPDLQIVTNQLYDETKKSTDVLVDTVRNMKKDIFIKPYLAERKLYVMPSADTMNAHAQNSLLKVLEEPPEYCTIILIAENSNLFLPTILSRAVPVRFFPLSEADVEGFLKKQFPELGESTAAVAAMSGGCIGRAKELAEDDEVMQLRNELFSGVLALSGRGTRSVYDFMLFLKHSKENIKLVFDILQGLFRDLLHIKQSNSTDGILNRDKVSELGQIAEKIRTDAPVRMLEILIRYTEYLARNISLAQVSQCMSLELWEVMHD